MRRDLDDYLLHVVERIIGMFKYYADRIDPRDEELLSFLAQRLPERALRDPRALPYRELYSLLKSLLEEFARSREGRG